MTYSPIPEILFVRRPFSIVQIPVFFVYTSFAHRSTYSAATTFLMFIILYTLLVRLWKHVMDRELDWFALFAKVENVGILVYWLHGCCPSSLKVLAGQCRRTCKLHGRTEKVIDIRIVLNAFCKGKGSLKESKSEHRLCKQRFPLLFSARERVR